MGIFESLKNAILGHSLHPGPVPGGSSTAAANPQPVGVPPQPTTAQQTPQPTEQVDIAAVLSQRAAQRGERLNWQSSIVDLMKLVDLDPSLENRKTLAQELGYTGSTQDSATMNIWLHREVMQRLAASGGRVPDSLLRH